MKEKSHDHVKSIHSKLLQGMHQAGQIGQGNQSRAIRADRAVGSVHSKSIHLVLGKQQLEVWVVHI